MYRFNCTIFNICKLQSSSHTLGKQLPSKVGQYCDPCTEIAWGRGKLKMCCWGDIRLGGFPVHALTIMLMQS